MNTEMATKNDDDWQVGKSLVECNRYKLEHEIDCDVTFVMGNPDSCSQIRAHKSMMSARSPVFAAMFSGKFSNKHEVPVSDIEAGAFKEMLRYMYTDEVILTDDNVIQVLVSAKKYILEGLENLCTDFIMNGLNTDNACVLLDLGNNLSAHCLKEGCISFIAGNTKAVLQTDGFLELSKDSLLDILKNNELNVESEGDIFKACIAWAKHKTPSEADNSGENLREVLGPCLYYIRFGKMSPEEFVETGAKNEILSTEEIAAFLCYIIKRDSKLLLEKSGFNLTPRYCQSIVYLFDHKRVVPFNPQSANQAQSDSIFITVEKRVKITGFTLLTCGARKTYNVSLNIAYDNSVHGPSSTLVAPTPSQRQRLASQTRVLNMETQVEGTVNTAHAPLKLADPLSVNAMDGMKVTFSIRNGVLPKFTANKIYDAVNKHNMIISLHPDNHGQRVKFPLISGIIFEEI